MVQVKIHKGSFGYDSITAKNHSDDPLICASVSAIMWGLAGTLMNLDDKPNIRTMVLNPGNFEIEINPLFGEGQKFIDTCFFFAVVALKQIEKNNPQFLEVIHI